MRYSPVQMFDLVNDVEAYPRRFAWCAGAQVLAREDGALTARLELRVAGMTQAFTTRNSLTPPRGIAMQLVDGPFRHLAGAGIHRAATVAKSRWRWISITPALDGSDHARRVRETGRSHGR